MLTATRGISKYRKFYSPSYLQAQLHGELRTDGKVSCFRQHKAIQNRGTPHGTRSKFNGKIGGHKLILIWGIRTAEDSDHGSGRSSKAHLRERKLVPNAIRHPPYYYPSSLPQDNRLTPTLFPRDETRIASAGILRGRERKWPRSATNGGVGLPPLCDLRGRQVPSDGGPRLGRSRQDERAGVGGGWRSSRRHPRRRLTKEKP